MFFNKLLNQELTAHAGSLLPQFFFRFAVQGRA